MINQTRPCRYGLLTWVYETRLYRSYQASIVQALRGGGPGRHGLRLGCTVAAGATLCAALALPARADMRCGTELITQGDSAARVREACGEPLAGDPDTLEDGVWTYNFGPEEFMIRVIIIDGTVQRFEQLGRGFIQAADEANPDDIP